MYNYSQPGGKIGKRVRITRWLQYSNGTSAQYANTSTDLNATFAYDNEGRMTSQTWPSYGPVESQTMGRVSTVNDGSLVRQPATYGPAGELLTMSNGVAETRTYNSMLQLTHLISGGVDIAYAYSATQNNGKIVSQTDNVSGEQIVYTYDALNRLAAAQATNNSWGQSYSYDGFGNLTDQNVIAGSAPSYHIVPNAATNNLGGEDLNGNAPLGAYGQFAYDIENRIALVAGYQYSYAPGNKRVMRSSCCTTENLTSFNFPVANEELTFWSVSGQRMATYQLSQSPANYIGTSQLVATQTGTWYYFGGKLIKNKSGYIGTDRLGSIGKYYPYGQEKPSATTNGTEKFTGYFRDSETGLDYANNRFHNPGTGRFLTTDPSDQSFDPKNPLSWDRYTYVTDDPIGMTDPEGLSGDPLSCLGDLGSYTDNQPDPNCTVQITMDQISGMTLTCADGSALCPMDQAVWTAVGPGDPNSSQTITVSAYWESVFMQAGVATGYTATPPPVDQGSVTWAPSINPVPTGKYSQYLGCVLRGWNETISDPAAWAINIGPFAALRGTTGAPGLGTALGVAAAFNLGNALAIRNACTAETYGPPPKGHR